jgi:anaerobic ribonucleoside-triphosphate reductase
VYTKSQSIRYIGDKSNANTDSALVATKRCLIFNELNKELYRKFFMTVDELDACKKGYIYIHDQSARLDTHNCFSRDTRFITDDGVKSFYDFNDGDTVTVMSHLGVWRNATVHCYGKQELQKVVLNPIAHNNLHVDIYCTKDHRWILDDGSYTTSLSIGNRLYKTNYVSHSGFDAWEVGDIEIDTDGTLFDVWCLDVEEDHSFMLEFGIPTGNCMLFDAETVLSGGFEMGNVWYNEPKGLDTFFDVLGDVILSTAAQQYGGFTIPEIDKLAVKYAHLSYDTYYDEYYEIVEIEKNSVEDTDTVKEKADKFATKKVYDDYVSGWKGIEYKLNTVGSSRGDYPFVTVTMGLSTDTFGVMCTEVGLREHSKGRGKKGNKQPVLFPKYVFLYDDNLHGEGKPYEWLFDVAIQCSLKTMYPDYLSMSGEGYISSMYKKYGKAISPMG